MFICNSPLHWFPTTLLWTKCKPVVYTLETDLWDKLRLAQTEPARHTVLSSCLFVLSVFAKYMSCWYVSVIPVSLTCNSYYDVLRRAALTITLLDCRVLDFRGYIVLCGSGQNHCLLALGLGGRRLRTKCILSCFWGSGWLVHCCSCSRGWWDLWQEVCCLCGWGCGGCRCCYGYCVGLLRLKVLWVSRSCHSNQCFEALFLWIKRESNH